MLRAITVEKVDIFLGTVDRKGRRLLGGVTLRRNAIIVKGLDICQGIALSLQTRGRRPLGGVTLRRNAIIAKGLDICQGIALSRQTRGTLLIPSAITVKKVGIFQGIARMKQLLGLDKLG